MGQRVQLDVVCKTAPWQLPPPPGGVRADIRCSPREQIARCTRQGTCGREVHANTRAALRNFDARLSASRLPPRGQRLRPHLEHIGVHGVHTQGQDEHARASSQRCQKLAQNPVTLAPAVTTTAAVTVAEPAAAIRSAIAAQKPSHTEAARQANLARPSRSDKGRKQASRPNCATSQRRSRTTLAAPVCAHSMARLHPNAPNRAAQNRAVPPFSASVASRLTNPTILQRVNDTSALAMDVTISKAQPGKPARLPVHCSASNADTHPRQTAAVCAARTTYDRHERVRTQTCRPRSRWTR